MTPLAPTYRSLEPPVRLVVLVYWSALLLIFVYNVRVRTRLPMHTGLKDREPVLLMLFRFILTATFFGAPYLFVREWLGLEILLFAVCLLLFYPWWTTRHIAIPLRMPRLAYALTAFGGMEWWFDKPEGPVAAAAWCLSRQRKATKQSVTWAEKHLVPSRPLRASTVAAHAMLAAVRGQFSEARMLFESMLLLHGRTAPVPMWRLCFEWLATDAAARGDWAAVRRIAAHYLAPRVSTLLLLADLAGRPPGKRKASIVEVFLSRLPFRSPNLKPILSGKPTPRGASKELNIVSPVSLEGALRASLDSADPHSASLTVLAETWDSILCDEHLRQRLALRSAALGGGDADTTLHQLRQLVESDLTEAIDAVLKNEESVSGESPLLKSALSSRRRRLLTELEERMARLDARRNKDQALPAIDEWKEFLAFHRTYTSIYAPDESPDRTIAFNMISLRLNSFAVWLHSQKKESVIANAIFRFLLPEARRSNSPSLEILSRNAKLSITDFTIKSERHPRSLRG
jgi:hypothetical protein